MFLLKGFILGFCIAAPVGPIGLLCINRTLNDGLKIGLYTGLGAAAADAIYGLIAGTSTTFAARALTNEEYYVKVLGGFFLCFLGYKILKSKEQKLKTKRIPHYQSLKAFLTTFVFTLASPATILAFVGVFAGLGIGTDTERYQDVVWLVIGIFFGSLLWWLILSYSTFKAKKFISTKTLRYINLFSGMIILGFGVYMLYDFYVSFNLPKIKLS